MHPQHSNVHINWRSTPQQRVETVLTFRPYLHNDWTLKGKQVVHCTSLCTAFWNSFEFCDSDKSTTNAPYFSAAAFLHSAPTKATCVGESGASLHTGQDLAVTTTTYLCGAMDSELTIPVVTCRPGVAPHLCVGLINRLDNQETGSRASG